MYVKNLFEECMTVLVDLLRFPGAVLSTLDKRKTENHLNTMLPVRVVNKQMPGIKQIPKG